MIVTELDKQTADEILVELFPSGCSPIQRFAVELANARHRGRVLERVAAYVRKCAKGSTISSTTSSPYVTLASVRAELRQMLDELADRISTECQEEATK